MLGLDEATKAASELGAYEFGILFGVVRFCGCNELGGIALGAENGAYRPRVALRLDGVAGRELAAGVVQERPQAFRGGSHPGLLSQSQLSDSA